MTKCPFCPLPLDTEETGVIHQTHIYLYFVLENKNQFRTIRAHKSCMRRILNEFHCSQKWHGITFEEFIERELLK